MALVANYESSNEDSSEEETSGLNLPYQALPQSKTEESDVLEDFVKKTDYGQKHIAPPSQLSHSQNLTGARLSKVNGKVRITVPSLQSIDSDEEDVPASKKPKISSGLSGMLSSLPAPKNTSLSKERNRRLLPQSLTQKSQPVKQIVKKTRATPSTSLQSNDTTQEQSDDEEEGNFFSFDSASKAENTSMFHEPSNSSLTQTADYTFGPSQGISMVGVHDSSIASAAISSYDPSTDVEDMPVCEDTTGSYEQTHEENDISAILQDEQFLKLQGKRRRGKKEEITFIDVHSDDQKSSELELTKNLSQEVPASAYAHRKTGGPSGMTKRKHQITYLAYQAKERELELKNTWANNRMTRMQTQAKYGF